MHPEEGEIELHPEMEEFLDILGGTSKKESTVKQYRKGLERFSGWLEEQDQEPAEVTTRDIQRYLSYLKNDQELAPNTIRVQFAAVSQFYSDYVSAGKMSDDPTDDIQLAEYAPKTTRKEVATKQERVWLSQDEIEALVENVPGPSVRNRLVVLFQYYTGLRREEVSNVKLEDLNREKRQVQIRGKGGKIHTAHWQPTLDGLLTAWIDQGYRMASPYARESEYLFVTESSPRLSGDRINKIVGEAAENAGIQEVLYTDAGGNDQHRVTSHTLRHSFGMHYLQNGGSIEGLSKLLAHSSVTTTEIYGEILEERAKDEYEEFAPDIDLSL